jgi:hypothetical protein
MLSTRIPSVRDTYFQHKVLTQVHGKPTYESLQTLATEVKANAGSVPSTAGGGANGHLGMILSAARYATLQGTVPWVQPVNPGAFLPPVPAGTAAQIEAARDVWREANQAFALGQATEKALVAQIVESIDPIYIRALLNRTTGQFATNIRAVMTHLFTTYGKITPQQVTAKQQALYSMHYDITQPVDTVFNTIEDLADLSEHALSPMTAQQQIDMAYVIFARDPILQQDIRLWNRRPVLDRTWPNMIEHFRDAQADLSALPTAADVYHQQPPHQANSVATIADMVAQRLLDAIPSEETPAPPLVAAESANAVSQRESDLQSRESALQAQMQEMMALMRATTSKNTDNRNRYPNSQRGRGRGDDRNYGRGRGGRHNNIPASPRKYCWSHGSCAHTGAECNTTVPGHQAAATFANMQGGSTQGCYWLNT